jgi:hypothetical protein
LFSEKLPVMINNPVLKCTALWLLGILILSGCRHEIPDLNSGSDGGNNGNSGGGSSGNNNVPCDPNKIYFKQQVLPILISNCAMSGCHDDASRSDGVILTSYEKVMATADVRPGRPGNSDLYEVLVETRPDKRMPRPPQNPLTQQQIQLIYDWIKQGAKNLECASLCDENNFSYSSTIKLIISNKCQGCHSGGAPQGGIDLSTYSGVKAKITDGRLWGAINHQQGFSPMPKNGAKLSDCEITQFRKWMDAGAPEN